MQLQNTEIHGHEVLEMMTASGHPYSTESLIAAIHQQFSADTRFYICSASGMTASELIETLWAKGKFAGDPDSFIFDISKRCNH
jgi:probable metal-binding protein